MPEFEFAIIADGVDIDNEAFEDRFFEAGCDDALLMIVKGNVILEFTREAANVAEAVATAIRDVHRAGARVKRIAPDSYVTISDIAERSGLTRQAISLYTKAERGSGFPNPVARVTSNSPLWDWLEVTEWLHAQSKIDREAVVEARIVKEANRFLELHKGQPDNFTRRLEMLETA